MPSGLYGPDNAVSHFNWHQRVGQIMLLEKGVQTQPTFGDSTSELSNEGNC